MNRLLPIFLAVGALSLAADPFVATWTPAHLDQWKVSPGGSSEQSKLYSVTSESTGKDSYKNTRPAIDGKAPVMPPFTTLLDGVGRRGATGITVRGDRIDDHRFRITASSSKSRVTEDFVVAPDGKSQTITRKGIGTASGRHVDELLIFEKQ
jgi:hypothetical protein